MTEITLTDEQYRELVDTLEAGGMITLRNRSTNLLTWRIKEVSHGTSLPGKKDAELRSSIVSNVSFVQKIKQRYLSTVV